MSHLIVAPAALNDATILISFLNLPQDTWSRIRTSLQLLEQFPRAGRQLSGEGQGQRYLVGPWPWLIIVYSYNEQTDLVSVLSIQDARSSTAAPGHSL